MNQKEKTNQLLVVKTDILLAYLLVVAGAIIYISLTFNNNVWLDEAFTATLVNGSFKEVLDRSMADTLPPLYNLLLRLTTLIFGYRVPVMKITSAVPMIITMILGATTVRRRFGAITSYIFILAVTFMPNMMFYGVEIRMYSLGFLFATASGIYMYEVLLEPTLKNWCIFTIVSVLAGYSHHFAFVTVGFVYLFLLIVSIRNTLLYKKSEPGIAPAKINIKSFLLCVLATFILYFPCLLTTLKQLKSVSGYFSMPEVTLSVFAKYCRYPFTVGFTPLSGILLVLIFVLYFITLLKKNKTLKDYYSLWCLIIFYGVLLFGTLVSKIMTANIFVDRYLFFALGLVWLFFSISIGTSKSKFIYAVFVLEIAVGIVSYKDALSSEYAKGADTLTEFLKANVSEGDALYTLEDYEELAYCLPFYDNDFTNYEDLQEAVDNSQGNTIWCAVLDGYDISGKHPDGNLGYKAYVEEIEALGYEMIKEGDFTFDRYSFKLYTLKKGL